MNFYLEKNLIIIEMVCKKCFNCNFLIKINKKKKKIKMI